jgi:hypothetical protein
VSRTPPRPTAQPPRAEAVPLLDVKPRVFRDPHRSAVLGIYLYLDTSELVWQHQWGDQDFDVEEACERLVESAKDAIYTALMAARDKVPGHP